MSTPIDNALGEGNCGRDRGKEAGAKPARLRTETAYKADSPGECANGHRRAALVAKPFPTGGMVNAELVQGKFAFLSGEGWNPGPGVGFMPKAGVGL